MILLLFASCKLSFDDYVKSKDAWVYKSGYNIDDMNFNLDSGFSIKNDTIFFENKPKAIVTDVSRLKGELTIKSLDGKQTGHYVDVRNVIH